MVHLMSRNSLNEWSLLGVANTTENVGFQGEFRRTLRPQRR